MRLRFLKVNEIMEVAGATKIVGGVRKMMENA